MHSDYEDDGFGFGSVREMMGSKMMRNMQAGTQMSSMTMSFSSGGDGGNFVTTTQSSSTTYG